MIIRNVEIFPVSFRLTESYATAYETTSEVHNVVCRVETKAGLVGWGNAAPDPCVMGETSTSVVQASDQQLGPALLGEDAARIHYLHAKLSEAVPGNYAAKAGLNIALYDLLGKRAGLPLYQLLGCYRRKILTSVTIGIAPPEETVRRAVALAGGGFKTPQLQRGPGLGGGCGAGAQGPRGGREGDASPPGRQSGLRCRGGSEFDPGPGGGGDRVSRATDAGGTALQPAAGHSPKPDPDHGRRDRPELHRHLPRGGSLLRRPHQYQADEGGRTHERHENEYHRRGRRDRDDGGMHG